MVARTAGGREVAGSNPVAPIFYFLSHADSVDGVQAMQARFRFATSRSMRTKFAMLSPYTRNQPVTLTRASSRRAAGWLRVHGL